MGADLAVTDLNERAKKHVEPLARALESSIFVPLDVGVAGQTEAVFERIGKEWGQLDFLVHSIAFSPKEALHGRVIDVGIANEQSIAWGCAKAFRALGADLAVTYLNEKAKKHVEPLAQALESSIFLPMDVRIAGQTEAVFEQIEKDWGQLDFLVHSIAFSPKEALHGRVIDVKRDGFLATMDVSCWSFLRMAHLAEPLMKKGGTMFTMTYYGSQMVVENYNIMGVAKAALECAVRYVASEVGPKGIRVHAISPGPLATRAASGIPEFDDLMAKAQSKAPARSLVSIDDVGKAVAFLALDGAKLMTGDTIYIDGGYHIMD